MNEPRAAERRPRASEGGSRNAWAGTAYSTTDARSTQYVSTALQRELASVVEAQPGARNDALNVSALKIGSLVGAGAIGAETATQALLDAALSVGLQPAEAKATIRSGLRAGERNPRALPVDAGRLSPAAPKPTRPPDTGQRARATALWHRVCDGHRFDEVVAAHPYCQRKGIAHAFGAARLEVDGEDLVVVPIRDRGIGEVLAVQTIDPSGQKRTYGRLEAPDGSPIYLLLGEESDRRFTWLACEGWATALALAEALHVRREPAPVLVAFGSSRLELVAHAARQEYGARVCVVPDGGAWA